jgi:glucose/arabinose dehydrogenase
MNSRHLHKHRKFLKLICATLIGILLPFIATFFPLTGLQPISAQVSRPFFYNEAGPLPTRRLKRAAATFPSGFLSEDVVSDLTLPTSIAFASDRRMFIAEKGGVVKVAQLNNGGSYELASKPFIDLSSEVYSVGDRGLLSLTLHPNFPATPYVYLLYTYNPPGLSSTVNGARVSRLLRVEANPNNSNIASSAANSRVVLMGKNSTAAAIQDPNTLESLTCQNGNSAYIQDCLPSDFDSHSIGTVTFGKDGALYVTNGDASSYTKVDKRALRSQDLDSMAGKLFRIDPLSGQGYSSNPFYDGNLDSNRSKVAAYGFRNPFRVAVNPADGELYIGDVGWRVWEEINISSPTSGKNFGWPCYEGGSGTSAPQPGYQNDPNTSARCAQLYQQGAGAVQAATYAWNRQGAEGAVVAGDFYTGTTWPSQYRGAFFFGDYGRKWLKYRQPDGTIANFATSVGTFVDMTASPDKNIYYVAIADGKIQRLRYNGSGNNPPVASFQADPTAGNPPLTVRFNSSSSYDPDGEALTYSWEFGDGNTSTAANPTHVYQTSGNYTAKLTVTDPSGAVNSATIAIYAGTQVDLTITSPSNNSRYNIGDTISFTGRAIEPNGGNISDRIQWKVNLYHDQHVHFDQYSGTGSSGSFTTIDHGDNTYYEVCANITFNNQTTKKCIFLRPNTVEYTFQSVPSGLNLAYEGASYQTPFTVTTLVNSEIDVSASPSNGCAFQSWSDGGNASRTLRVGNTNKTYTANYLCNANLTKLFIEAESGKLFEPFYTIGESSASNGKYVSVRDGYESFDRRPESGRAYYSFNVPTAGTYKIWGRTYAPNKDRNSFWVRVDNGTWYKWNGINISDNWSWDDVHNYDAGSTPVTWNLSAGSHTLKIAYREARTGIDRILITNDLNFVP